MTSKAKDQIEQGKEQIRHLTAGLERHTHALTTELLSIYERLALETAAREASDRARFHLAAIVESADDAIISVDLAGTIHSWNPGAKHLFGYSAAEAIGQPVTMLLPPGHEEEESAVFERLRRGEHIEHIESIRRRKDGTLVPVSLTISAVSDDDGRIVGASKIVRDITAELQQAEARGKLIAELRSAMVKSETTEGLIPICAHCKMIRDDSGIWRPLEDYLTAQTGAAFTHGVCPACMDSHYPELRDQP